MEEEEARRRVGGGTATRWREEAATCSTSVVGSCWMHPHASAWAHVSPPRFYTSAGVAAGDGLIRG
jgi:hypothetical protein